MRAALQNRQRNGTFIAKPPLVTVINSGTFNVAQCSPRTNTFTDSIYGEDNVTSRVLTLFNRKRPLTIVRFIISVIIFTFQRMLRCWSPTKTGQELFVGRKQKTNTPSAVPFIVAHMRVLTTTFGTVINVVLNRSGFAVRNASLALEFSLKATTRLAHMAEQAINCYRFYSATLAFTEPISMIAYLACVSQDGQASERFVLQVLKSWIGWFGLKNYAIFNVGHIFSPIENLIRPQVVTDFRAISILT